MTIMTIKHTILRMCNASRNGTVITKLNICVIVKVNLYYYIAHDLTFNTITTILYAYMHITAPHTLKANQTKEICVDVL